jgi:nucleotide-binding universal stress UspA family protein
MAEILLAYDGSDHARKALEKAISLATEEDEIVVLYVIPTALIDEFKGLDPEISKGKAREIVNEAVDIIKARERKALAVVHEGDVAEDIINFAGELDCTLIIIGSKGVSKIGRFSLGSVAEKVARHAECPVLIVR